MNEAKCEIYSGQGDFDALVADLNLRHLAVARLSARPELGRYQVRSLVDSMRVIAEGLKITVPFPVASARLAHGTAESLHSLAASLGCLPNLRVKLEGYTESDGLGPHDYHLTRDRVACVAHLLVSSRVDSWKIYPRAYQLVRKGQALASSGRVVVTFSGPGL